MNVYKSFASIHHSYCMRFISTRYKNRISLPLCRCRMDSSDSVDNPEGESVESSNEEVSSGGDSVITGGVIGTGKGESFLGNIFKKIFGI